MTPDSWTQLVLVLLAGAVATGVLSWTPLGRVVFVPFTVVLLGAAAATASLAGDLAHGRLATTLLVTLAAALAVAGGGPITTRVFDIVDRADSSGTSARSMTDAGLILRGGAWIGALERLAVFAGLAAGFPEGVAVVLALKGVGRFPDLKDDAREGVGRGAATERFIIGTFASVLWAAGCAGVVALVLGR